MPEPTTTSVATIATATATLPAVAALGASLGLRADVLVAGFGGALVAIVLLNTVPSEGDTWRHLLRSSLRRMAVAFASSLTAGYLVPLALLAANLPPSAMLGLSFLVGAFAQKALVSLAARYIGPDAAAGARGAGGGAGGAGGATGGQP